MSSPFYRSYWGMPSYSQPSVSRFRGIPVAEAEAKTTKKASPKVISIPVHFVGSGERTRSESESESDSAVKIQKVLRGFLVRKSIKKIASIRNEVHQIESRVSEPETVDLIKRDAKERLRLNETLMNLLLRLDCITSVDFGVRFCRKSVIKRAISLQEKLDLMASSQIQDQEIKEDRDDDDNDMSQKQSLELHIDEAENCGRLEDVSEDVNAEIMDNCDSLANSEVESEDPRLEASTPTVENEEKMKTEVNEIEMKENANNALCGEESVGTNQCEEINLMQKNERMDMAPQCDETEKDVISRREEQNGNRELLERMMEDNERMMMLMAELCERNDIQTRLLCSLSHRVEQMEKALACEKLRKKKKRNADVAAAASGSDKLSNTKKM